MKRMLATMLFAIQLLPFAGFRGYGETKADTAWYDAAQWEYTISTPEQLLGLSKLSLEGRSFQGKTIYLGADICLNEGRVTSVAPENVWKPLVNFSGVIDGKGHTISGLYAVGKSTVGFIATANGATVKNLSIVNSYFATTEGNSVSAFLALGSSTGNLSVERCYTDATLFSAGHNAGGFIACVGSASKASVSECWFDGTILLKHRYGAAILANGDGKEISVRHCLNTGTVHSENYYSDSHVASMVGRNDGNSIVEDCLNLGVVSTAYTEAGHKDEIGALFGRASNGGTARLSRCAALEGTVPESNLFGTAVGGLWTEDVVFLNKEQLTGRKALTHSALDFESYWTCVADGYPCLTIFAPEGLEPPLEVKRPVLSQSELKLEGRFGPRWILTLELPEDVRKQDVKVGALIVPTVAIPAGHSLKLEDRSFLYKGKEYEVANVEAKHLRKSGENTIVCSFVVTDLDAKSIFSSFTCVPYAAYNWGGESIQLYGEASSMAFYPMALRSYDAGNVNEKRALDAIFRLVEKQLKELPSQREGWEITSVPAFQGGILSELFTVGESRYDWDCEAYRIEGVSLSMYRLYLTTLKKAGFVLHADNGAEGIQKECYQASLYTDEQTVNVCYFANSLEVYVTIEQLPVLSDKQIPSAASSDLLEGQTVQLNLFPLQAEGESLIFQLKNGHYVIVDGAQQHNAASTVKYLVEHAPKGEKPVVDGWFFTHAHPDHTFCAKAIGEDPALASQICVEGIYFTWPNDKGVRRDPGYSELCNQISAFRAAVKNLKTEKGIQAPVYKLHAGQRFYFAGVEVQVLACQDQLYPEQYKNFNCSSTSYRFVIGEQDVLIMGDAHQPVCTRLMELYSKEVLSPTFFQTLHHSSNDVPEFFKFIAPEYLLVTRDRLNDSEGNRWLQSTVKQIFYPGDPEIVFPYGK